MREFFRRLLPWYLPGAINKFKWNIQSGNFRIAFSQIYVHLKSGLISDLRTGENNTPIIISNFTMFISFLCILSPTQIPLINRQYHLFPLMWSIYLALWGLHFFYYQCNPARELYMAVIHLYINSRLNVFYVLSRLFTDIETCKKCAFWHFMISIIFYLLSYFWPEVKVIGVQFLGYSIIMWISHILFTIITPQIRFPK